MKKNIKTWAVAVFAMSALHTSIVTAQEIERGNPFVAPPSWAEEQARLDERTRIIFRELEPEMKNDVLRRVNESQATLEIKLRKRIDLVAQTIADIQKSSQAPANNPQNGVAEAGKSIVPEGSKFVSCLSGEALYRDANNILFKVPKDDPKSRDLCSK
jgi:hypothetical protein